MRTCVPLLLAEAVAVRAWHEHVGERAVSEEIYYYYYYYLLETSFYMALSATFFTDISRKVRAAACTFSLLAHALVSASSLVLLLCRPPSPSFLQTTISIVELADSAACAAPAPVSLASR